MFSEQCVRNVLVDLAGHVARQSFTIHHKHYIAGLHWQDDLGLDSMQVMELAAYSNTMFHLFETDVSNYLLEDGWVDNWVRKIMRARQEKNDQITFRTSGTTRGQATVVTHSMAYLMREVAQLARLLQGATQVVTYVPAHSIYGFLFTVLLPGHIQVPVLHASQVQWSQLPPTTLLVATPFHWPLILPAFQQNTALSCMGTSATAMLSQELQADIIAAGINLLDVYGSTETSGIGYRREQQAFQLFPYLSFTQQQGATMVVDTETNQVLPLQDELLVQENGYFTLQRRKDNQINIAGNLVSLQAIEGEILQIDNIKTCTITAKMTGHQLELMALIVLTTDTPVLRQQAINDIRKVMPAHKTPRHFHFNV